MFCDTSLSKLLSMHPQAFSSAQTRHEDKCEIRDVDDKLTRAPASMLTCGFKLVHIFRTDQIKGSPQGLHWMAVLHSRPLEPSKQSMKKEIKKEMQALTPFFGRK
jgi:hypothetical protein